MAVLSKQHVPPLYNLNHFIINCPIFQYVHKFFTVCSHFVHFSISLLFPVPFGRRSVCRILCLLIISLTARIHLHNSIYYCKPSRLHKKYVLFSTHPHCPQSFSRKCAKVIHSAFGPFCRKKQLYTDLSTLSTFFLCLSPVFSRQGKRSHFLYTSHKFSFFDKKYTILP